MTMITTVKRFLLYAQSTKLLFLLLSSWMRRPCHARRMDFRRVLSVQSYSSSSKGKDAPGKLEAKE